MSKDDRFKGIDWQDVLYRLTLRARQLFSLACASGYSAALAHTGVTPDDLAQQVILEALKDEKVKFRPGRASAITFLRHVLDNDFKDLLRKGRHRLSVMVVVDAAADPEKQDPRYAGVLPDVGDSDRCARRVELRAVLMDLVKGDAELEDYIVAVVDCGAKKPADQAELLGVSVAEITNRRKRLMRLAAAKTREAARVKP
jgi:DNA-directed RNA polymerase specialized sigma24 family protein